MVIEQACELFYLLRIGSNLLQPHGASTSVGSTNSKYDLPELDDVEPNLLKPIPDNGKSTFFAQFYQLCDNYILYNYVLFNFNSGVLLSLPNEIPKEKKKGKKKGKKGGKSYSASSHKGRGKKKKK